LARGSIRGAFLHRHDRKTRRYSPALNVDVPARVAEVGFRMGTIGTARTCGRWVRLRHPRVRRCVDRSQRVSVRARAPIRRQSEGSSPGRNAT
jgi:hypothetical protein